MLTIDDIFRRGNSCESEEKIYFDAGDQDKEYKNQFVSRLLIVVWYEIL